MICPPNPLDETSRRLLEAASFAARAHRHQLRKDGQTPYVGHPFRVCLVVSRLFGMDDLQVLTAAILHDTIEDTTTDFDDVKEQFGQEVAEWVALLSKDKRLEEEQREEAYIQQLASAPWQVKVCKLGDVYDNLLDMTGFPVPKQVETFKKAHRYLDALYRDMPKSLRGPWELVSGLLTALEARQAGQAGGA